VATWSNSFLPLVMRNSLNLYPLTGGLAQWQADAAGRSGSRALFSTIITGSFLAFPFLQRYWQSGLASGAVKG